MWLYARKKQKCNSINGYFYNRINQIVLKLIIVFIFTRYKEKLNYTVYIFLILTSILFLYKITREKNKFYYKF